MSVKDRLSQTWNSAWSWLEAQEFYQSLKAKWDELEPQTQLTLQWAGGASGVMLVFALFGSFVWSVGSLRRDVEAKSELIQLLRNAGDEIARVRSTINLPSGAEGEPNWNALLTELAPAANVDPAKISVSSPKPLGGSDALSEAQVEVRLTKLNLKQIIRYSLQVESSGQPFKLKSVLIDTQGDPEGYLDATLTLSAFYQP